ncbi:YaeQ family protein [Pseudoalteromonas piscicida]|uniref:YaeQ family protein n=1 Tax=Pseudoalteromonas piscicida TaxID=43662 RepID=UPI0030AFA7DA
MNKPFVFKARIKVADLFHHSHHEEAFTTAMLAKESSEHFAMKLLGICALSYDKPAKWSKVAKKYWPDVWLEDDNEQVEVALFIGSLEVDEIIKYEKLYAKVVVLCIDGEHWFEERRAQLQFIESFSVFNIPSSFITELCEMLTRSLHWDVIFETSAISVTDGEHYIRAQVTKLI